MTDRPAATTAPCPFCGTALKVLPQAISARCLLCGERGRTRTWCTQGHFVCEDCRTGELWALVAGLLEQEHSTDPVEVFVRMRASHDFPRHGPEHHPLVAAAFLLAYRNCHGEPEWPVILDTLQSATEQLPGGTCGFWGACSAGLAVGMAYCALLDSSPTSGAPRAAAHQAVSQIMARIAQYPAARCCRRECLLALQVACDLSPTLLPHPLTTTYREPCPQVEDNEECLGEACPWR